MSTPSARTAPHRALAASSVVVQVSVRSARLIVDVGLAFGAHDDAPVCAGGRLNFDLIPDAPSEQSGTERRESRRSEAPEGHFRRMHDDVPLEGAVFEADCHRLTEVDAIRVIG